ncbi:hypothetical protein GCM10027037_04890 [Mucilaginibacter koreensis]
MSKFRIVLVVFTLWCFTGLAQVRHETMKFNWPAEYNWKMISNQNTANAQMVEVVPGNQSATNWSILGTSMIYKTTRNANLQSIAQMTYQQMLKRAPLAQLHIYEQDAVKHYIIFKIESPSFNNRKAPESQLYYFVQGQSALFCNFVAIKEPKISLAFVNKWIPILKTGRLVYN